MEAIEIRDISKSYRQVHAVKDISLDVGEGEIFGLIGPDGAGKTTLFRIMTTLMIADSGSGRICGLDIVRDYYKIRRLIGYMPGRFSLYQDLSVKENLDFFATMFGTTLKDSYGTINQGNIFTDRTVQGPQGRKAIRRNETETRPVLRPCPQAFGVVFR